MSAPASACTSNCVSTGVNVYTTLTLTGLNPGVNFPSAGPGQQTAVPGAESSTVTTSDPAGYTLQLDGANLASNTSSIPASAITVTEKQTAPGSFPLSTSPVTIHATNGPTGAGGDQYAEDWPLTVPSDTNPGQYTGSQHYVLVGN